MLSHFPVRVGTMGSISVSYDSPCKKYGLPLEMWGIWSPLIAKIVGIRENLQESHKTALWMHPWLCDPITSILETFSFPIKSSCIADWVPTGNPWSTTEIYYPNRHLAMAQFCFESIIININIAHRYFSRTE